MKRDGYWEREQRIADIVVLLGVACVALVTWSRSGYSGAIPLWKSYLIVLLTMFLALAALTRHSYWAASIRLLTGGWIIAAPYLLGFANTALAQQTYLTIGTVMLAVSLPDIPWLRRLCSGRPFNVLPRAVERTESASP